MTQDFREDDKATRTSIRVRLEEWDEREKLMQGGVRKAVGGSGDYTSPAPLEGAPGRWVPITSIAQWYPGPLSLLFSKILTSF